MSATVINPMVVLAPMRSMLSPIQSVPMNTADRAMSVSHSRSIHFRKEQF